MPTPNYFVLCFLVYFLPVSALAETNKLLTISNVPEGIEINQYAQYKNVSASAQFAEIRDNDQGWQTNFEQVKNKNEAVWMRFLLENPTTKPVNAVLLVESNTASVLYVNGKPTTKINYLIESMWVLDGIKYCYQVNVPPSQSVEVYCKILPEQTVLGKMGFAHFNLPKPEIKLFQKTFFEKYRVNVLARSEAARRFSFLIMGGLFILSVVSLLITVTRKQRLFLFYFLYVVCPFALLLIKEVSQSYIETLTVHHSLIDFLAHSPEYLQMISLSGYVLFVIELVDLKQNPTFLLKMMRYLVGGLLLYGLVEVISLGLTGDIKLHEQLFTVSGAVFFPAFIFVIFWLSFKVRHYLIKYVILSNIIFISTLFLGYLRFGVFTDAVVPVYIDQMFTLPFATMLEAIIFSYAVAVKINYDNNLRIESEKRLYQTEMMALRSQMNPHFIFNSLNTIRNFVLQHDNTNASKYLSKFSKLLREILNFSRSNVISLADELATVKLYLELESARFDEGFHYEVTIPPDLDVDAIAIPPLLLQPYVENAIWHGLRHSTKAEKLVRISLTEQGDELKISILDNGVGRKEAARYSNETKASYGTKITAERIDIFNKMESSAIEVETYDLPEGTEVILTYHLN